MSLLTLETAHTTGKHQCLHSVIRAEPVQSWQAVFHTHYWALGLVI